jgi:sortase A
LVENGMLKRTNWFIVLGALVFLIGTANLVIQVRSSELSPLDVVDAQTEEDGFIPILQPAGTQDAPQGGSNLAPTIVSQGEQAVPQAPAIAGRIPDRLVIPSIFLDAPILPVHYKDVEVGGEIYHQWRVPAEFAVGWQDGSALLGLPGNTVLNGHHNAYGMVFKDLVEMKIGDEIQVHAGEETFRYLVAAKLLLPERGQTLEIRQENARWLAASEDERLTLVTCWPADSNTHRVVIVAFPAP